MMDAAGERKDKEDIMRTIAIINLKGGVAKTTSSINIAYILMRKGWETTTTIIRLQSFYKKNKVLALQF